MTIAQKKKKVLHTVGFIKSTLSPGPIKLPYTLIVTASLHIDIYQVYKADQLIAIKIILCMLQPEL